MKNMRQLLALFLAFALVIGVFSTPTVAYAEDILQTTTLKPTSVQINYEKERLEVTKTASQDIYYTMKYLEKTHSKTEWEDAFVNTTTQALIDFSNTTSTKDVIVYITDDKSKRPIEIIVKAQENALAVAFSGVAKTSIVSKIKYKEDWTALNEITDGYKNGNVTLKNPWIYGFLCVTVGKPDVAEAMTAYEATNYLEFRKGMTGEWQSIKELDVRKYTAYGTTLYFRIKATNATTVTTKGAITTLGRPSNVVKVVYARQPKAPRININGVTKQIALAKTQEYRTFTTATDGTKDYGSWIPVKDMHMVGTKVKTVYLKDLLKSPTVGDTWDYKEDKVGQGIELRNVATDKTIASKTASIELNKATAPTVGSGAAIQFQLVKSITYEKGIKVFNTSTTPAQVAVVSGTSFNVNNSKEVKWVNVLAGKSITLSGSMLAKGDIIIARTATIKDNPNTTTDEFVVSSQYETYDYKTELPLLSQKFVVSTNTTVTSSVVGVTPSAIVAGTSPYEVTVTNTASPSAITVVLDVTTENIVAGTPQISCVTAANDFASVTTANKVKLLTNGAFTATAGTLKITIAQDAIAETKIFRVTIDGKKTYITINFQTN